MLLEFAETPSAQPVHISRVRPGQADTLFCPHCQQPVIANTRLTGQWIPEPHFVHIRQNCQYVGFYDQEKHIHIPLYRGFELYPDLNIVAGNLPLFELYKLQQDAMRYVYSLFYQEAPRSTAGADSSSYRRTDWKLFQWTIEKCSLFTLYLVEIQLANETIYHIGSSDHPQEAYLLKLSKEFPLPDVVRDMSLRLALPHMASLEYYFQHRFRLAWYPFDDYHMLPDYFRFPSDSLEQVIAELQHLQYVTNTRRENILLGILKARMSGKRIGRPSEDLEQFLHKKKSREIAELLDQGMNISEVRRRTGYARKTIRKVKALLHQQRNNG